MKYPEVNINVFFDRVSQVYEQVGIPRDVFDKWVMPLADLKALVNVFVAKQPRRILEIGTYVGMTTQMLANYSPRDAVIDTIDPNFPLNLEIAAMRVSDRLDSNVRTFDVAIQASDALGLRNKIRYHAGGSTTDLSFATENNQESEVIPVVGPDICKRYGPFDFIVIDGLHYDFAVESDLELASRHLAPSGVIAIHDVIGRWGSNVRRASLRFLHKHPEFQFQHFPYADLYHGMGFFTMRDRPVEINLSKTFPNQPGLLDNEILLDSLCAWIVEKLAPKRVIMVGPDYHDLLPKLIDHGITDIACLKPDAGLAEKTASQCLTVYWNYDLPLPEISSGDLCICLSVSDHLSEKAQTHLVAACTALAPVVLFSNTDPGEMDPTYFTSQPFRSWFNYFWHAGFLPSDDIRQHLEPWLAASKQTSTHLLSSFGLNILIFKKCIDIPKEVWQNASFQNAHADAFIRINELCVQQMESNLRLSESIKIQNAVDSHNQSLQATVDDFIASINKRSKIRKATNFAIGYIEEFISLLRKREKRLIKEKFIKNLKEIPYAINLLMAQRIVNLPFIEPRFDISIPKLLHAQSLKPSEKRRYCFFVGSLSPGGAERQVAALARELSARGETVQVFCQFLESEEQRHYLPSLEEANIPARVPRQRALIKALLHIRRSQRDISIFQYIPPSIRLDVLRLYGELLLSPTDILHCWLDQTNCIGGWVGLLAGVPLIRLSFRNMNPTRFPYLYQSWMPSTYTYLSMHPNVTFEANSTLGRQDYANWLGISKEKINVIPNGVCETVFESPDENKLLALRSSLGIDQDAPLICCVFRLSPEKRPLDMISIMLRLRRLLPNVHLIHAGVGAMEKEVREKIKQFDLEDCIHLLGRRKDIPNLLTAADVLLLTSEYEGMPNAIMESLLFERPVVATYAGGAPEVIIPGENGFLHRPGDITGLTQSLYKLLVDRQLNRQFGVAGRQRILSDFTSCRLADTVLRSYASSLE